MKRGAVGDTEWLKRKPAHETPYNVSVKLLDGQPQAKNNKLDEGPALAA